MNNVININGLTKVVNGKTILEDISMQVKQGEIYGFLGPNGAGKTTVMKTILTISSSSSGSIEIFGKDLSSNREEILKEIGSIIEVPIFYDNCTASEILEIHSNYMGIDAKASIPEVLKLVGLESTVDKKVNEFSLGMKQRLGLARALLTKPKLLILDEPINGLDPMGVQHIRDVLSMLSKEKGMTILISSHILSEIEHIADTIGVIRNGRMIEQVSMESLKEQQIDLESYFMTHFKSSQTVNLNY